MKTDQRDSYKLAHLLRTDYIPEVYKRSGENRSSQRVLRQRAFYVAKLTSVKNRLQALLAQQGEEIRGEVSRVENLFTVKEMRVLAGLALPEREAKMVGELLKTSHHLEDRISETNAFGFALECRIYAEDPDNDFMPSPGKIVHLRTPSGGLGVRDDNGVYEGYEVPMEYDPLLSKLITWGRTREEAIHRMLRALSEYQVYGIKTTIPFFKRILLHPKFLAGDYNTHFISNLEKEQDGTEPEEREIALIAAGIKVYSERKAGSSPSAQRRGSNWKFQGRLQNFSNRL